MRLRRLQRDVTAVLLVCLMLVSGCASTVAPRTGTPAVPQNDTRLLADYVQRLPIGSPVRVERLNGRGLRGTLLKATDDVLVLQLRTRIPEPPIEVRMSEVTRVTRDEGDGRSLAKAIGIGVAAGAGAALGVFLIIVAALD